MLQNPVYTYFLKHVPLAYQCELDDLVHVKNVRVKEENAFFFFRNAYKNSWPITLLPELRLMGYRKWPQK